METIKKCIHCGISFVSSHKNNTCCSKECIARASYNKRIGEITRLRRKYLKVVPCKICGNPVPPVMRNCKMGRKRFHQDCVIKDAYMALISLKGCKCREVERARNQGFKSCTEIMRLGRQMLQNQQRE